MISLHGLFILLFFMSTLDKNIGLQLLHRQVLQNIPSASGITVIDGQLYVIGDNTP